MLFFFVNAIASYCILFVRDLKIAAIGGRGVLVTTKGCPAGPLLSSPPSDLAVDFTSRSCLCVFECVFVFSFMRAYDSGVLIPRQKCVFYFLSLFCSVAHFWFSTLVYSRFVCFNIFTCCTLPPSCLSTPPQPGASSLPLASAKTPSQAVRTARWALIGPNSWARERWLAGRYRYTLRKRIQREGMYVKDTERGEGGCLAVWLVVSDSCFLKCFPLQASKRGGAVAVTLREGGRVELAGNACTVSEGLLSA